MSLGPARGTDKYNNQIDTVYTQFTTSAMTKEDLDKFLLLFILDTSYSRGAIATADHKIRHQYLNERPMSQ